VSWNARSLVHVSSKREAMRVVFELFGSNSGSIGWTFRRAFWVDSSSRARTEDAGRDGVTSTMRGYAVR